MLDTQLGSSSLGLEKEPNVFSMPIEACMAYTGNGAGSTAGWV
jgi:hypothetical protein